MEGVIVASLLTMMAAATVAIAVQRNLFAVVILSGIYSFLMATALVALDAVDVAMTEAAVGAGISTVLLLSALYLSRGEEVKPLHTPFLPLIVAIATGGALVYGTLDLPAFSDPDAAIHRHVAPRYIESAMEETGVPNVVTAVLASYRGYDTLGETTVVFTAGIGVIAKAMIAFMLLFALYVQFHGDFGPGGGFQAGVIVAASVVLYAIIYGLEAARMVVPDRVIESLIASGVLLFAGVGVAGILLGGNYLDYFVLSGDPVHGQHRGIFWVEAGVLLTVFAVMLKVFYLFAGRTHQDVEK